MTSSTRLIFSGASILTEQGWLKDHVLVVEEGRIQAIAPQQSQSTFLPAAEIIFPAGYSLVPGFIDLHIHGAKGFDVMDASAAALENISQALAEEGVTSFLATTMSAKPENIEAVLSIVNQAMSSPLAGARLLGVHLEGPFIAPGKKGAQCSEHLLMPNVTLMQRWYDLSPGTIKLVTLAPELPHALELIRYLRSVGVVVAAGHTEANYDEAMAAIAMGCSHATHLFNAMRPLHQREPGVVAALLLAEQVMAELIVDGVHLHPAIVKLAYALKGFERLLLVTDAMRAKCLGAGHYDLGGQSVCVEGNTARLSDQTLAGSVLRMPTAIKNIMNFTGCTLAQAVQMASANPAKSLGIFSAKGSIAVGKDADLVVLNANGEVVQTICAGKDVYKDLSISLA